MMKITGLSHLFKWENLHNWWLTKYFFAPLYVYVYIYLICIICIYVLLLVFSVICMHQGSESNAILILCMYGTYGRIDNKADFDMLFVLGQIIIK